MSDLSKRLRSDCIPDAAVGDLLLQAADEIEQLERERDDAATKSRIDEEQCDWATDKAGELAITVTDLRAQLAAAQAHSRALREALEEHSELLSDSLTRLELEKRAVGLSPCVDQVIHNLRRISSDYCAALAATDGGKE